MQVLEVAIGLVAAFFAVSVIASAVVGSIALVFKKRSKDLEAVIHRMIGDPDAAKAQFNLYTTSVFETFQIAARRKHGPGAATDTRNPSYVSARSFADAAIEKLADVKATVERGEDAFDKVMAKLPNGPFKKRLAVLISEAEGDMVKVKAGLESWFDDTMDRLEGSFKRWAQWWAAILGIAFALLLNVSAVRIVDSLWSDSTLRGAVADAAGQYLEQHPPSANETEDGLHRIQESIASLDDLKLPVGWGSGWSDQSGPVPTLLGCLLTGLAAMMGAQFWLGLLTRLVSARKAGGVPSKAAEDPLSASNLTFSAEGPTARGLTDPAATFLDALPADHARVTR